jgi:4-hydroxy-tetrahydrodipicolinate synthase
VKLSAQAAALGCGGVLMLPPFYYKGVSDEGVFRAVAEVIERVGDAGSRSTSTTSRRLPSSATRWP